MKIVIFSGGTGSVQLQKGLYETFGKDVLDYTVITNLADNGLSTGECRKVMDGKIMGPSDLRKNQMLRAKLENSISEKLYEFLNDRITISADEVQSVLLDRIHKLDIDMFYRGVLASGVNQFFDSQLSPQIDYIDFSISNIIYSGIAKKHNYSLDSAGKVFEGILDIPENSVISNTDSPMYLMAKTQSGYIIHDEADIVSWNNPDDKIVDCFFVDNHNKPVIPELSELSKSVILSADIIIFSSGTQWSSLIPTYKSIGFSETISESKAKKYLILNASQDADMKGVSGDELINILMDYLPKDTTIISALDGDPLLIPDSYQKISAFLLNQGKHDGKALVKTIFDHYYNYPKISDQYVFDYDDTIVARGSQHSKVSKSNVKRVQELYNKTNNVWISTGNTINALHGNFSNIKALADGGVNLYKFNKEGIPQFEKCLDNDLLFSKNDIEYITADIVDCGIDITKIQIRGKVMISIKPISPEYRHSIKLLLESKLSKYDLLIRMSGRTTIDITKPNLDKILATETLFVNDFTYIGDEGESGNDHQISQCGHCNFIPVKDVKDTNMYLAILLGKDD
jgi:2-phospho-L-lactate transferase/gluconeogenesis factor (CofD/UPF0052 family)